MNKTISYSLWGSNPKYTIGAIYNAKLAPIIYPGWNCRFYVGSDVSQNIIAQLKNLGVEIIHKNENNDWTGMFWRFEAAYNCDISIFRDTDSRLSMREKYAVDEWLATDKTFHIMRDHPFHNFPILGGMWGYKNTNKYPIKNMLEEFNKTNEYGTDYKFFIEKLSPLIGEDKVVHDPFYDKKDFPTTRINKEFVGDVFDEFNNRHPEYYKLIP